MKRMLPRTAAGQLMAVALLTLLVSQMAMLAMLAYEEQTTSRKRWSDYIFGRIASAVELLDQTPESLHQQVIYASDTRFLTYEITSQGPEPQTSIDEDSPYLSELRAVIPKDPSKVLVDVRGTNWLEIFSHWWSAWRGQPPPVTEPWLEATVQLKNGQWLNLEVTPFFRPPSLALLLIPTGIMLTVFGSALFVVIRHITLPTRRLAGAAEAFGRGEEVGPVAVTGPAEIRQALAAFNDMRERLSRFVLDRTKMLAAVGHDLRTPITTMRLRAEFIEDDEIRSRILASLNEMQQMAEGALAFAREEAIAEPSRLVDLNALVQTICTDQAEMDRPVSYKENGRLPYRCRPNTLTRAIRNLVENAVVHGKCARVQLDDSSNAIRISVEDDGPGIPEESLPQVFMPFVRLDESRGQETGGIGLGLAIARSIVRGHGGDITIVNRHEGGVNATIQLPTQA